MSQPRSLFAVLREAVKTRDPITGALGPAAFTRAVEAWLGGGAAARRPSSSLLLVRIDWGTRGGRTVRPARRQAEAVLRTVADITGSCLRATDVLGRVDDDTMGVLLPSTPAQQAEQVCRRIRAAASERTPATGFPITVSIGLATGLATDPWRDARSALDDAALGGGNAIVLAGASAPTTPNVG